MTKQTLFLLCASLCLSFALPKTALAQASQKEETHKATVAKPSNDKTQGSKGLLADGIEVKKKISSMRKLRDEELRKKEELEALEAPSEELYGEDSWGEYVNPFAGMSVDIPESYDINLDGFVSPLDNKRVTSHYGYRARFGRNHYGADMGLSVGDTVRAAFSGKVRIASYQARGYGNYVVIRHPNGLETVYGHLHRRIVTEGTVVQAGEPIGLGGNTGFSTAPHLHFEARFMGIPLNPEELFDLELGAPHFDNYTFNKSDYRKAVSHTHSYASSARQKAAGPSKKGNRQQTHRIRKGDTLSSIASRYGTTVKALQRLNPKLSGKLQAGKPLRVS